MYNQRNRLYKDVYEIILIKANEDLIANPTERSEYTTNTRRIEARAFVALVTYILEQNGADFGVLNGITDPNVPSHQVAADSLMAGLIDKGVINSFPWAVIKGGVQDDAVKWSVSMMQIARMLDLYLALENAYQHYGHPDYANTSTTNLLGTTDKELVLENYARETDDLDDLGNLEVPFGGTGVNMDEVQAGNWPMKVHVAVGYAALMQQDVGGSHPYQHWVERALRSAGAPTSQNRNKHWNYQTSSGDRFFAESPYYLRWSLREVVPFWHATRINGMLSYHPDFNVSDPFRFSWFLDPLEWLADTVTPDGRTPALDDGNKQRIRLSSLLRWTNAYGAGSIGQKFAWINEQVGGPAQEQEVLLVELAIPRVAGPGTEPVAQLPVNSTASQTGNDDEQQVLVRRRLDAKDHYVLLNGEKNDAIVRGEGHEQPDQLQLLYYIDDASYLMDAGYDRGRPKNSSSWNAYHHHNVLNGEDCGLPSPYRSVTKKRKVSDHDPVNDLYREQHGRVALLHGEQPLECIESSSSGGTIYYRDYNRYSLFVEDPLRPYLIDLNRMPDAKLSDDAKMRYNANSNTINVGSISGDGVGNVTWSNNHDDGQNLYLYTAGLKRKLTSTDFFVQDIVVQEKSDRPIKRLHLGGLVDGYYGTASIFQAGSTSPSNTPALLWDYSNVDGHQGWVWKQSNDVYDVFVARAGETNPLVFNLQDANGSYPYLRLSLASSSAFGFARVRRINNQWRIDSDYQIHLDIGAPTTTISGPAQLDPGQSGTWTATASGGDGSYSYQWYRKFDADPDYIAVSGATASSYTNSYQGNVSLKVEVTSVGLAGDDTHDVTVDCDPCVQSPIGFSKTDSTSTTNSETKTASDPGSTFVLPDQFALETSVPNPVRTQATIRYALPEASDVTLTVYDVMGREVAQLVQSAKAAGFHEVQFDASPLPSGTYLYRLRAGVFTETRRMVVVR